MSEQKAKIRKTFNYLIRALIILFTYGFIYRQVFVMRKLEEIPGILARMTERPNMSFLLGLVLLLMLVNWGIESAKWRILIAKIEKVSFFRSFKAVLTGVSVSLFTPNRTGDYLGRIFILDKGNHVEGILLTLVGSFAQIIVTFSVGLFCLLSFIDNYLRISWQMQEYIFISLIFIVPCIVFILLLLYFNIKLLTDFIGRFLPRKWERFTGYARVMAGFSNKELLAVLLLSLLRYLIFSTQFYLLLKIFGAGLPFIQGMVLIPVIYLAMALIPSVTLAELGIRGSISIFVIGLYFKKYGAVNPDTDIAILASSSVLWLVNLIIPAILGTFFVFSLKFFRK